jgi:succinate dehydrogenase/fumarate reductase flavoprotein subunit
MRGDWDKILYLSESTGIKLEFLSNMYSCERRIPDLYSELKIPFRETSIGILPTVQNAGFEISRRLYDAQKGNVITNCELLSTQFIGCDDVNFEHVVCNPKTNLVSYINSDITCFATGGFGGTFPITDCVRNSDGSGIAIASRMGAAVANMDTVMRHPFGINNGKQILTGDKTSKIAHYYEMVKGNIRNFFMPDDLADAIKNNNYHNSDYFTQLVRMFRDRKIFVEFSNKIGELIQICSTVHYTSGGIQGEIENDVRFEDKNGRMIYKPGQYAYAIGEALADGNVGCGRFPGHPFASSIIQAVEMAGYFESFMKSGKIRKFHNFESNLFWCDEIYDCPAGTVIKTEREINKQQMKQLLQRSR